jgi:hypothetical protein
VISEADWQKESSGKEGSKASTQQELRGFERD